MRQMVGIFQKKMILAKTGVLYSLKVKSALSRVGIRALNILAPMLIRMAYRKNLHHLLNCSKLIKIEKALHSLQQIQTSYQQKLLSSSFIQIQQNYEAICCISQGLEVLDPILSSKMRQLKRAKSFHQITREFRTHKQNLKLINIGLANIARFCNKIKKTSLQHIKRIINTEQLLSDWEGILKSQSCLQIFSILRHNIFRQLNPSFRKIFHYANLAPDRQKGLHLLSKAIKRNIRLRFDTIINTSEHLNFRGIAMWEILNRYYQRNVSTGVQCAVAHYFQLFSASCIEQYLDQAYFDIYRVSHLIHAVENIERYGIQRGDYKQNLDLLSEIIDGMIYKRVAGDAFSAIKKVKAEVEHRYERQLIACNLLRDFFIRSLRKGFVKMKSRAEENWVELLRGQSLGIVLRKYQANNMRRLFVLLRKNLLSRKLGVLVTVFNQLRFKRLSPGFNLLLYNYSYNNELSRIISTIDLKDQLIKPSKGTSTPILEKITKTPPTSRFRRRSRA